MTSFAQILFMYCGGIVASCLGAAVFGVGFGSYLRGGGGLPVGFVGAALVAAGVLMVLRSVPKNLAAC